MEFIPNVLGMGMSEYMREVSKILKELKQISEDSKDLHEFVEKFRDYMNRDDSLLKAVTISNIIYTISVAIDIIGDAVEGDIGVSVKNEVTKLLNIPNETDTKIESANFIIDKLNNDKFCIAILILLMTSVLLSNIFSFTAYVWFDDLIKAFGEME